MPLISCDGAPPPLLMVVEYLESSMSNDLLYKFPDNSALDFNYAQSSIWSPLLPRAALLTYEEVGLLENTKKIAGKIKRKFTDAVLNNVSRCIKMKRRRRRSFRFSPRRHPSPSPKGLAKVMKGAANQFKKRMKKSSNLDFDHS
ncbi:uncharacterized protein LOC125197228 [Salvia hispanica]|uniref:uncharacterized protein LOC125197228 n=1 Tax=Salvia hispanica TaxID=49212 RepID=UPI0020093493|nr:uncharacterized protein LOC125197228 [Salvia hispanica]